MDSDPQDVYGACAVIKTVSPAACYVGQTNLWCASTVAADLPLARASLQLAGDFNDLRDPGCTEWMPAAQQTTGWIERNAPAN